MEPATEPAVETAFRDDDAPRIVTACAPLRVSLAGGGTDLPSYACRYGALVVSMAINRYVGVTVFPRSFTGDAEIRNGTARGADGDPFTRAVMLRAGVHRNVQVAVCSDVPAGVGLGGSGAYTVALLHALRSRVDADPRTLAEQASAVEMDDLRRPVGKHDHYMAAYGGLRALHIDRHQAVEPEPVPIGAALRAYIEDRLLLFYIGHRRDAGEVLAAQNAQTESGDSETVRSLRAIHSLADEMLDVVRNQQVDDVGALLHAHWMAKSRLSGRVTNAHIDTLYNAALEAGADGGKVLGAGGGGFLAISSRPGRMAEIRAAMAGRGVVELPFGQADHGSRALALPL